MKKMLYVSFENSKNSASGVNKKIFGQIQAFRDKGFTVDFIARYDNGIAFWKDGATPQTIASRLPWRIALCGWARRHAEAYDTAYIRFQFFCPFVLSMVHVFHRVGVRTVMEIPTYPYIDELKTQGPRGILKILVDRLFQKPCKRYIDGFTSPAYEGKILGTDPIPMNNGIDMEGIVPRRPSLAADGSVSLLAVSSMAPWHGYDRVIEGLRRYYEGRPERTVYFHMVGEGSALEGYRELVRQYGLTDKVIFWGRLSGEPLDEVHDRCQIGVCGLGTHRRGIARTNALKALEYLSKGMPIVCDDSEVALGSGHPYRLDVPMDDSPVDIGAVVAFFDSVYRTGKPEEAVIDEIRARCAAECTMDRAMEHVTDFLMN